MSRLLVILGLSIGCSEYSYNDKSQAVDPGSATDVQEPSSETEDTSADDPPLDLEPSDDGSEPAEEPASEPDPDPAIDEGFDPEAEDPPMAIPEGKVVTILMTLSDLWIPISVADALIGNAVAFASPVTNPNVLIIRDDNHNGENEDDPEQIAQWLVSSGFSVDIIEEPTDGIEESALMGYHVAIFSNPGYPPDDTATIDALRAFSVQGYGVIFQGDDMTAMPYPPLQELTRLSFVDNGGVYYGVTVDNDQGDAYAVTMAAASVLSAGIANESFPYGNDIDTATPTTSDLSVAAWCTIQGSSFPEKPVITAFAPQQSPLE